MPQRFRLPDEFTPKLVSALREGISGRDLRADAIAGLTVAIVALPLSMAIAIASGVPPERGLYTAIIGGLLVSALGGSRLQVGGPAGAFIVLIYSIVERNGYDGLVLATMMAGVIMIIFGAAARRRLHQVHPLPRHRGISRPASPSSSSPARSRNCSASTSSRNRPRCCRSCRRSPPPSAPSTRWPSSLRPLPAPPYRY